MTASMNTSSGGALLMTSKMDSTEGEEIYNFTGIYTGNFKAFFLNMLSCQLEAEHPLTSLTLPEKAER
jgi:hypothetical protein